jgi:capsular polysaccharide biosynthesis protein
LLNRLECADFAKRQDERSYQIYAGLRYEEFDPAQKDFGEVAWTEPGEQVAFREPKFLIGTPETPSCLQGIVSRMLPIVEKNIRLFSDAEITGWRSAITPRGFYSSARFEDDEKLRSTAIDGYAACGPRCFRPVSAEGSVKWRGRGFFLSYIEPGNHGSFIFRALPKLLLIAASGLRFDYVIAPDRSDALRAVLDRLGLAGMPVLTCKEAIGFRFEELYVADDFDAEGLLCTNTMSRIRSLVVGAKGGPEQIYVSRKLGRGFRPHYRPLVNEAEIEAELEGRGFQVLTAEALGFHQQMDLFAGARTVIGPSGSGMLNTVFSPAGGTVLDLESFVTTVRQHAKIYSSSSKEYGFVFGRFCGTAPADYLRPWKVEREILMEAIRAVQV